eukprot:CAMPEP_0203844100 /NCGR_PEP_ID=MMETSP0359-20131031/2991_1 /ASSEMBLY_ACC=CAM_ASM_000338 /TAXON_ID=268821 /ORGANISM="Scrippsiella Hangoei, Strain SHTV-5" /LENGTH=60 /DNA_ID=CAMNT_0050758973 /DNA_START=23 /DNA_END=205 /DNA_ORIENTATION=-
MRVPKAWRRGRRWSQSPAKKGAHARASSGDVFDGDKRAARTKPNSNSEFGSAKGGRWLSS